MSRISYDAPEVVFFEAEELNSIVATMSGGGGYAGGSAGNSGSSSSGGSTGGSPSPYQDFLYCPGGALWKCKTPPTYVTPYGSYIKSLWFVPKKYISALIDVISQDQYLDIMEKLTKGTISLAQAAAGFYAGSAMMEKTIGKFIAVASALCSFYDVLQIDLFAFSDLLISSIRKNAGGSEGSAVYKNGIKLTVQYFYSTGFLEYSSSSWSEISYLYGPQNHHGEWYKNEDLFVSE